MLQVYAVAQSDLASEHDEYLSGEDNARWANDAHYRAINYALREWGNWVTHPHLYTITDGFAPGTYEYSLPDYMDGMVVPQYKLPGDPTDLEEFSGAGDDWRTFARYQVDATAAEGRTLRLTTNPHTSEGRILWYARNGIIPTSATLPVLNAEVSASATSAVLTTKPIVGRSGYLYINAEWLFYAGVTEAATTLTLNNLVRGLFGTTAAVHAASDDVEWGVAVQDPRLWNWLQDLAGCYLHLQYLNKASGAQREYHEFQWRMLRQQADDFKMSFRGGDSGRMRLTANPM